MDKQLYDLSNLEEITGGDKDFMTNMIQLFLEHVPEDIKKIEEAITSNDYNTISKVAHKLKPSVNYMCVDELYNTVRQIEAWEGDDSIMVQKTKDFIVSILTAVEQLKNLN